MKLLDWKVDIMEESVEMWNIFYDNLDTLFEECNQCGKCSSGCPAARVLELRPRKIALVAQRDRLEELLTYDVIWTCAQCHQCMERCPRDVTPYDIIIYLQNMAVKKYNYYPRDLKMMSNAITRSSRIQNVQEIIDREFEDIIRDNLPLPKLVGPKNMDAFRKAINAISGEEK